MAVEGLVLQGDARDVVFFGAALPERAVGAHVAAARLSGHHGVPLTLLVLVVGEASAGAAPAVVHGRAHALGEAVPVDAVVVEAMLGQLLGVRDAAVLALV